MDKSQQHIKIQKSLLRVSRWIWIGLFSQTTLFAFYGLNFFISETFATSAVLPIVIFASMALFTFFYGVHFFKNYTQLRFKKIMDLPEKNRREALLLAVVIQLLLVQFVCILGIFLSVFQQQGYFVYPFFAVFVLGMWKCYPQSQWFDQFFGGTV